ncbi:uncharacterized protein LOC128206820 [Mya arenaria]|uniref:uncharacterized protein LOC128206820 n=1 Tax=Mya arenaria TaxID=6604 RepID=UPI0022E43D05|nr:uncharacterized protein LOC128206820 [Mya arenaria]
MACFNILIVLSWVFALTSAQQEDRCKKEHGGLRTTINDLMLTYKKDIGRLEALIQANSAKKEKDIAVLQFENAQLKKEMESLKQTSTQGFAQGRNRRARRQGSEGPAAFTACIGSADLTNLGNHHVIVFDHLLTNYGNAYHNTTGIFRAPSDGVYAFHLSAMSTAHHALYLEIVQDGRRIDDVLSDAGSSSTYASVGEMWTLKLQRGSEVWIRARVAPNTVADIHGYCHTMFSGFQLFEIEGMNLIG